MATTVDRFSVCVQICGRLSSIANNMLKSVQTISDGFHGLIAGSVLNGNLPGAQQAFRDLGSALDAVGGPSGLDAIDQVVNANATAISNGLTAIGVVPADANSVRANLRTWINNLKAATISSSADVDTLVNNVKANVPSAFQTF